MKILVFHQYYLQPGESGGSRFNELARLWTRAGHSVTVIAGNLHHYTGSRVAQSGWVVQGQEGDATVFRCHVPPAYSRGYRGRMWGFAGFTLSALSAVFRAERPDVMIATSPPLVVVVPALLAATVRFRGTPWIFEVRDLWPESAISTGVLKVRSPLTWLLYKLEEWGCRRSDMVNVLTPAFREDLLRRGLVTPDRVCLVPNGADVDAFQPGPRDNDARRRLGWGDCFVVLYAGAHGRANAIGQLVDTAERLADQSDILIACVGDGPERGAWEAEAQRRGLENIRFHGPQPKEAMPEIVNACDVGAAVLQNNPTFRTVYPNKVFDYMACARPVLLAIDGVARQLVCDEARAGVFATPEDPNALAQAIRQLREDAQGRVHMGRRGREWVLRHATRGALAERYLRILEALPQRPRPRGGLAARLCKTLLDRAAALVGLVLLSPLLAVVALLIRLRTGRPVFFIQQRPGYRGRPFRLVKFRTMASGDLPDDQRLTRLGRFLRATSLDELPELWNVLAGDLSLVGPRPLLMRYLDRYTPEQARRHDVKPGITGWAQVNGRNALTWDERLRMDVWYVDHWSLLLDLKVLALTVARVVGRQGISHPGSATMPEFRGESEGERQGGAC